MQHHGAGLRALLEKEGRDREEQDALLTALCADPQQARIGSADRMLCRYALKLTRTPAAITARDVAALRDVGFDDRGIHDICAIVAYYNFVNRIADGLGVELEPGSSDGAA